METNLYLDIFFMTNFIMDFLIVWTADMLLGIKGCKIGRLFIAAAFGSAYSCLSILIWGPYGQHLLKTVCTYAVIGIIMSGICVGGADVRLLLTNIVFIYASIFLIGGINYAISMVTNSRWTLIIMTMISLFIILKCLIRRKKIGDCLVSVNLFHHGKCGKYVALVDTGNSLIDPYTGKPVCVISSESIKNLVDINSGHEKIRFIPFTSIGKSNGILPAITINKMTVENDSRNIRVLEDVIMAISEDGISKKQPYTIIINPVILECENRRRGI